MKIKELLEAGKIYSTSKDFARVGEFDDYLEYAKKTTYTIKGYDIYVASKRGSNHVAFLPVNPDTENTYGALLLSKDPGQKPVTSQIYFAQELQGLGLGPKLYEIAIKDFKFTIVSDDRQTIGGVHVWDKLARMSGITVYAWNTVEDKYSQWDPEEDNDDNVYSSKQMRDEMKSELDKYRKDIQAAILNDEIGYHKGKELISKKTEEIKKLIAQSEKTLDDVRLVATANKGL
jgi:hypothetical protein